MFIPDEYPGRAVPLQALMRRHLECCPDLGSSEQERHGLVGAGPEGTVKKLKGLEPRSFADRLVELGWISPERRRLWENFRELPSN